VRKAKDNAYAERSPPMLPSTYVFGNRNALQGSSNSCQKMDSQQDRTALALPSRHL